MNKINWCLNTKNGLEVIEPNQDLAVAYLKKAEDSLRATIVLRDNKDWEISSSYYTMYFSLYAILMKIGIKSEIHSCTIHFMKSFLKDYFIKEDVELVEKAQEARINTQYYSDRNISEELYFRMKKQTPLFMIKCKDVLNKLTEKEINMLRTKLRN